MDGNFKDQTGEKMGGMLLEPSHLFQSLLGTPGSQRCCII